MKGLIITNKGIENIAALEVKELIKAKSEIKETTIIFNLKKKEDLNLLCYRGQSFGKVLELIDCFEFNKEESLIKKINRLKIKLKKKKTFRVKCKRIGEHNFSSQEIEDEIGKLIDMKCDLNNPDAIFYAYIYHNMFYLGVDVSGLDLSKRDYKIFSVPNSLKGTIAYSLVRIAGYKEGEVLLDCFCGSGEIMIEAALFASKMPVNYFGKNKFQFKLNFNKIDSKINKKIKNINCFDYMNNKVRAAEKNAKIAGVNKFLKFSRTDIGFLELKFRKKTVDKIITQVPALSKYSNARAIEKIYDEFFYQAEYILKDKGNIVVISDKKELILEKAKKYKFKLVKERTVFMGKRELIVLEFDK